MLDQLAAEVHMLEVKVGRGGRKGVEDEPPEEREEDASAAKAAAATAATATAHEGHEDVDDKNDGHGVVLEDDPSEPDTLDHPRDEHSGCDEGVAPSSCYFAANDQENQENQDGKKDGSRMDSSSSHQASRGAEPLDDHSGVRKPATVALVHDPTSPPGQVDSCLTTAAADATADTGKGRKEHSDENGQLRIALREATTSAENLRRGSAASQRL